MIFVRVLFVVALVLAVSPAIAGEATYVDMRGKWQSTQCPAPQTVPASENTSEAAANDLNTQVILHNQYVSEAKIYMDCLASEANKDAHAMSYLVTESVKMLIDQTQNKIKQSSFHIKKKQEDDQSIF